MVYRATVGAAPSGRRIYVDASTTATSTEDRNRVFYERLATCQNKGGTGNVITTGQQQQIIGINGLNQYRIGQQQIIPVATAGGGSIRYISRVPATPNREVANLRQLQQNAGIVGNLARNSIITNVQNIAGNIEASEYSREYANANGDTLHLGNVEMRPSSKSGRIIKNGTISINPAANVHALSRKRDGDFLSQPPLTLQKQRISDVAGNSVSREEFYSRAQLRSDPNNFELNKLASSHQTPSQHTSNDVEVLAGSFVKGIIANDEEKFGQVNIRAGLEEQVQKIKYRLVELLKHEDVVDGTSHGSGMTSGRGAVYNGKGGQLLSNSTKPISTNKTKASSDHLFSEIMMDIEATIDSAAKKSARKAVQLAYIELKNRHDAMLSKQKRAVTADALGEKTPVTSINDERHSEEIDKLKKCHTAQIKALVKEQELFIAELTDKHLKEQQQSRDDKARKLRNCVLASSNALQVVRDVWDVE